MTPQVTLVLAEDEHDLATVIIRELETNGFEVLHATDGDSALKLSMADEVSLVILDWMLPKLDGLSVLRLLREQSIVPVLMLTARDAEIDRVMGLELGADDYLTKPFSMRELVARIRAMLRRRELIEQTVHADHGLGNEPIESSGVRLLSDEHNVTVDGIPIELTRTEFALLHLLLRNIGRVFSRSYLLDTVWGEGYVDGDRSVDNAVLRLRKKLGRAGELLETVYGVGYRWRKEN